MKILPPVAIGARRLLPSRWDVLAAVLVLGAIVLLADAGRQVVAPLATLKTHPVELNPWLLPEYALRTTLRMLVAMAFSLLFTFTYATWAAKSERAGALLVPVLDILQSVPILSFISITYVFFMSLAPGEVLGAEFGAIFGIFTSQAWNMAFSFYQSLRTVPVELDEAGRVFGLSAWARFWRIEVPFGMPSLVWNMMMSMSGSWFFVVVSEAITVGNRTITLPGIGSYIAVAIAHQDLAAIAYAIATMAIVILIYDQLLFRPLVAWADRFRFDQEQMEQTPTSWMLTVLRRSQLIDAAAAPFRSALRWSYRIAPPKPVNFPGAKNPLIGRLTDIAWYGVLAALVIYALWRAVTFIATGVTWHEALVATGLGFITMLRVFVLIAIASVIWTPIGIYVGMRPAVARFVQPIAQFLAAFPANFFYPLFVVGIVTWNLNADIWTSPLMILGTQWYILFNVIAGASGIPRDMRDAAANFQLKGWLWWKRVGLPGVFPFYVTGAITASGGSWNAAIVSEVVSWGPHTVHAHGLGAYLSDAYGSGDFHRLVLGTVIMSVMVAIINRIFWRPLYWYAERKYRLT
jgi:NitT/TauT family transport system permease protein